MVRDRRGTRLAARMRLALLLTAQAVTRPLSAQDLATNELYLSCVSRKGRG